MSSRILESETIIPGSIKEIFDFFSNAENLNRITPPQLEFKTTTPTPIFMKEGTIIDYRIKLFGIPLKWKTEITKWEPPYRFVDTQLKGPYLKWIHEHTFIEKGSRVYMYDKVEYLSPGWILEPLIHALFVKNNLEQIFNYRKSSLIGIFGK